MLVSVAGFGAVPSWGWYYWRGQNRSDWVNFMKDNYKPGYTYPDFASQFTAEFYNPDDWADLFKGVYVVTCILLDKFYKSFSCSYAQLHISYLCDFIKYSNELF